MPSPNGVANGTATNTERDELESAAGDDNPSRISSPMPERNTGASRRRAMRERAAEREAEEAMKAAAAAKERQEVKAARAEARQLALDRKRLEDEEAALEVKLHEIERDFRRHLYTLRARPLGVDRWHNRVWWLDGLGSAPLLNDGKVVWGTGRLYLQGAEALDIELSRQGLPHVTQGLGVDIPAAQLREKRAREEGDAALAPGEWAVYDTPEQLLAFYNWLNPRGRRDLDLHRTLKMWWAELEGGFHRRRVQMGLEAAPEEPTQRRTRRAVGEEERDGYMGWKVSRGGAAECELAKASGRRGVAEPEVLAHASPSLLLDEDLADPRTSARRASSPTPYHTPYHMHCPHLSPAGHNSIHASTASSGRRCARQSGRPRAPSA
jgi:hypothetical protein